MKRIIAAAIGAAFFLADAAFSPAQAQAICMANDDWARVLGDDFGERVAALGLSQRGYALWLYVDESDGSWTLLAEPPGREPCMVDAGVGWRDAPPPEGPQA